MAPHIFGDRGVIMISDDVEFDRLLKLATTVLRPKVGLRNRPTREEIELRAYQIYLSRGAAHGFDLEDWLQAEREFTSAPMGKSLARTD